MGILTCFLYSAATERQKEKKGRVIDKIFVLLVKRVWGLNDWREEGNRRTVGGQLEEQGLECREIYY
jgi:hypothetical protein